ncbi:MAG TPA: hypothetical protein IAD01_01005 [Candidatus Faeciplasma gallinarum]|uniref:Uncharacterized protein n=1 Tax=Candidatus Faeciplasma gallinarum TaxID=2840799 RepID=A0A9D1EMK3_9FIRM|nr:hypothetical protein [Candidatus Faeciplasma gallinarum]
MFKNIGRKIKGLAKGVFIAEVILIALAALTMLISYSMVLSRTQIASAIIGTLIIAAVWIFIAWLSVLVLYGFGELIDSNTKSEKHLEFLAKVEFDKLSPADKAKYGSISDGYGDQGYPNGYQGYQPNQGYQTNQGYQQSQAYQQGGYQANPYGANNQQTTYQDPTEQSNQSDGQNTRQ